MANALTIEHGTLLSFSYNVVDFGTDFRFGVRKVITIQVSELACGEKGAQGQIGSQAKKLDDLIETQDYITLTLNGHAFDELYQLTNFTLDDGNWQAITQGSITLEAYTKGYVKFDADGSDYYSWGNIKDWRLVEEFEDSFNFERSANSISYSHDVSVKFSALKVGVPGITPPLGAGLDIAKGLLDKDPRPEFEWLAEEELQGLYSNIGPTYKRFITETVDEINSTVKVSEKFSAENLKEGDEGSYSFSATQSVELTQEGIVNVSEKGKVIGLKEAGPIRAFPALELDAEIEEASKAGGRLTEVFAAHKVQWGEIYSCAEGIPNLVLNEEKTHVLLIEKGIVRDFYRGVGTYTIKGTNNQKINDKSIHEFTSTIEALDYEWKTDDPLPYIKASQRGTFKGISSNNKIPPGGEEEDRPRFKEAREGWNKERGDIKKDLQNCAGIPLGAYPVEITTAYSPFKGTVGYTVTYSGEPKYGTTLTPYKLWTIEYNDAQNAQGNHCVFQNTVQNVVNHPQEIQLVQRRNTTQLPAASASHRMVGKRKATLGELTDALLPLADLKDLEPDGEQLPTPNPKKVKSANYTFNDHNDKILGVSLGWE